MMNDKSGNDVEKDNKNMKTGALCKQYIRNIKSIKKITKFIKCKK